MPRGDIESLVFEAVAHADARCPRAASHPDTDSVAAEARAWAERGGLRPAARGLPVDRVNPVAPVGEAMREAPADALRIVGFFATWLAALAEHGERTGWDVGYGESLADVLGGAADSGRAGTDVLHRALAELVDRVTEAGGCALLPELADALARHTAAAHREHDWLARDVTPTLTEFLDNRVDRTSVPLLTVLHRLDPALGALDGPAAPGVPQLTEIAGLLTGVDEDLIGFRHAVATGTRVTLVPVLMREYGHSVPAAFQSATVLFGAWKTQLDHGVGAFEQEAGDPAPLRQARALVDWVAALHHHHADLHVRHRAVPVG
ncbi:MAG TPA: terpene synthase family protein [Yinghuangia sp.]|uniref:terpene synthase family protein n=1 Tax=Yinghuangia sp. YIM S10712 TaxID=3436930 RepID=UPI002C7E7FCC|nr:terpene synthase family protein [Yinghuangia sp.]